MSSNTVLQLDHTDDSTGGGGAMAASRTTGSSQVYSIEDVNAAARAQQAIEEANRLAANPSGNGGGNGGGNGNHGEPARAMSMQRSYSHSSGNRPDARTLRRSDSQHSLESGDPQKAGGGGGGQNGGQNGGGGVPVDKPPRYPDPPTYDQVAPDSGAAGGIAAVQIVDVTGDRLSLKASFSVRSSLGSLLAITITTRTPL